MAKSDTKAQILDKKFLSAAVLIGVCYVLIVVAIGYFGSKEAAGVAGVALTAIGTAAFKQFETLRFRQLHEGEGREIAVESPLVLLTLISSILGAQGLTSILLIVGTLAMFSQEELMMHAAQSPIAAMAIFFAIITIVSAITFTVSTYYSVRALRVVRYSTVIFADVIVAIAQLAVPLGAIYFALPGPMRPPPWYLIPGAAPWLVYVLMSLWGARMARPHQLVTQSVASMPAMDLQLAPLDSPDGQARGLGEVV